MRYPSAQEQSLVDKIERRRHQVKLLYAGAAQAVINQLLDEIDLLREQLEEIRRGSAESITAG
jgi:hypothetical protein